MAAARDVLLLVEHITALVEVMGVIVLVTFIAMALEAAVQAAMLVKVAEAVVAVVLSAKMRLRVVVAAAAALPITGRAMVVLRVVA